jgi:hypothetical protein
MEEWKPVPSLEEHYAISSEGNLRQLSDWPQRPAGRIIPKYISSDGYCLAGIRMPDGQKRIVRLHRLVALAFLGPVPAGTEVNHKDGNKANNKVENLEYVTRSENLRHAYRLGLNRRPSGAANPAAKLTDEQVQDIITSTESGATLVKRYGVVKSVISAIRLRKTWRNLGDLSERRALPPAGTRNPMAKLTEDDARAIRRSKETCFVLGERYGISFGTAAAIKRGDRWKHIQ